MEPIVLVVWRDAHFQFDPDPNEDYLVRTVGWLIDEEGPFLSVAQEELPDKAGYRAVTYIPVVALQELSYLEVAPTVVPEPATQAVWDESAA